MGYPLMLYRDSVSLEDHVIVADEAEEKAATESGYARLNQAALKGEQPDAPVKRGPGRPRKVVAED